MTKLKIELSIANNDILYQPLVEETISIEWTRKGTPGKLTFKLLNDKKIDFQEGNAVSLIVNDVKLFYGFVFTKKRDKENIISVTCYDQLRYFKNKDSRYYKCSASELIKSLSDDLLLKYGDIEDTSIVVSHRDDDTTIFDMLEEALEQTLELGGKMYTLYDDFGKITLKSIENMKLDCLVSADTIENFEYKSSIDSDTYNYIRLVYEDESGEKKNFDEKNVDNIKKWGVLQYFEEVDTRDIAARKAPILLSLYNSKRRKLSVSGVLGDLRVRAGCLLPVSLILGDVNSNTYLLVEDVKHTFKNGSHTMDLKLRGGKFV